MDPALAEAWHGKGNAQYKLEGSMRSSIFNTAPDTEPKASISAGDGDHKNRRGMRTILRSRHCGLGSKTGIFDLYYFTKA